MNASSHMSQIPFCQGLHRISIPLNKPSHTKPDASLPNYEQANHRYSDPTYTKLTPRLTLHLHVHYATLKTTPPNTSSPVQTS